MSPRHPDPSPVRGARAPRQGSRTSSDVDDRLSAIVASAKKLPLDARVRIANAVHAAVDEERFKINPPPNERNSSS